MTVKISPVGFQITGQSLPRPVLVEDFSLPMSVVDDAFVVTTRAGMPSMDVQFDLDPVALGDFVDYSRPLIVGASGPTLGRAVAGVLERRGGGGAPSNPNRRERRRQAAQRRGKL